MIRYNRLSDQGIIVPCSQMDSYFSFIRSGVTFSNLNSQMKILEVDPCSYDIHQPMYRNHGITVIVYSDVKMR